jgi:hypothetical protein
VSARKHTFFSSGMTGWPHSGELYQPHFRQRKSNTILKDSWSSPRRGASSSKLGSGIRELDLWEILGERFVPGWLPATGIDQNDRVIQRGPSNANSR